MKSKNPRMTKTGYAASIHNGDLYFEDVRQCALHDEIATEILDDKNLTAIRVVSLGSDWYQNVYITSDVKVKEEINFQMTLRKEKRGELFHWYAYRRVLGVLHKRYVGHSDRIDEARLLDIARALPSA